MTKLGCPDAIATRAARRGRKMRGAKRGQTHFSNTVSTTTPAPFWIRNAQAGACNSGVPTRPSPTQPYARQRQFQLHRFWRDRNEQASLRRLPAWPDNTHPQVHDG